MKLAGKNVLVTCGPTWVKIDDMRLISNRSSGELGQTLAVELKRAGARVTLLEGPVEKKLTAPDIRIKKFRFYHELSRLLSLELKKRYALVIHAAAVSDFQPKTVFKSKIASGRRHTLVLVPVRKLINKIKRASPRTNLIGFKLEPVLQKRFLQNKVKKLLQEARCDLVVANTLKNGYQAQIFGREGRILAKAASRRQLVRSLIKTVKEHL